MTVNLEQIATIAAREVERQIPVEAERLLALVRLLDAHQYASYMVDSRDAELPDVIDIQTLGRRIDELADRFRLTPVTFLNGGTAVHHDAIPGALNRMFGALDADTDPGEFVKAFLDVHPFRDGNGRTAWVLYNWLNGTLGEPVPLPDFYGQVTA